jgi:acetoin utilization deacetylase AcuC-like enzyme
VADGVRDAAGAALEQLSPTPIDDDRVAAVHDSGYLRRLADLDAIGGGWLDADTYVVPGSLHAARLAAGATHEAAQAVARSEVEVAFAVVRPPGHHAARSVGSGFCLFNNVAIAVAALRHAGLVERVAIVDWDVHHGDGTQAIFDRDAAVCYTSSHQSPLYPGTGAASETGIGEAAGTKLNHPLAPGSGDAEFVAAWRDHLLPAIEAFHPEAIIVSAGYDAHRDDPLAHLMVTADGYGAVSQLLGRLSRDLGLGGVALTLEGGYDLEAIRGAAAATVEGLLEGRR